MHLQLLKMKLLMLNLNVLMQLEMLGFQYPKVLFHQLGHLYILCRREPCDAAPPDLGLRRRRRATVQQAPVRRRGGSGAYDGIAVDTQGNVWCGFGGSGALGVDESALDGVRVYAADGTALAHIHLPERCANLCFGGPKNNRLFMASSHSLYALHVNARGAVT